MVLEKILRQVDIPHSGAGLEGSCREVWEEEIEVERVAGEWGVEELLQRMGRLGPCIVGCGCPLAAVLQRQDRVEGLLCPSG